MRSKLEIVFAVAAVVTAHRRKPATIAAMAAIATPYCGATATARPTGVLCARQQKSTIKEFVVVDARPTAIATATATATRPDASHKRLRPLTACMAQVRAAHATGPAVPPKSRPDTLGDAAMPREDAAGQRTPNMTLRRHAD